MAYNLLNLQTSVQDDLKDSGFSTGRITRYLNYGQLAIFNTHFFKFCEKLYSTTVSSSASTFTHQTDHQATIGGVLYDSSNTNNRFILDEDSFMESRDFFERYPDPTLNTASMPTNWTEFGGLIYFNCPLDRNCTFKIRYYRIPTDMSLAADVPDVPSSFRELLELYADYRGEKYRGNHDIAATYKQDFEDGLENMALRYSETTQVGPTVMGSNRVRVDES